MSRMRTAGLSTGSRVGLTLPTRRMQTAHPAGALVNRELLAGKERQAVPTAVARALGPDPVPPDAPRVLDVMCKSALSANVPVLWQVAYTLRAPKDVNASTSALQALLNCRRL